MKRKIPRITSGSPNWTPEQLEQECTQYFIDMEEEARPYTVPGLALYLGYATRHSVWDLKQKSDYSRIIKMALLSIETQRNEMLISDTNKATAGQIFDLKNNFDWVDKTEVTNTLKTALDDLLDTVDSRKTDE